MFALYLVVVASVATSVLAGSVSVQIPVEDQLPLIARVNQPYRWSISPRTFLASDGRLFYSISQLPSWLHFDVATLSFQGTPRPEDEGHPELVLTATDATSSTASSTFTISVSSHSPPTLRTPIADQLYESNPSLSSVFLPARHSAIIAAGKPALRIPPGWSFSIGFDGSTYEANNNLFYDARLADGSPLPNWIYFDPDTITFDGYTPKNGTGPLNLAFHATDELGYSAEVLYFDVAVASHELSLESPTLPTINVTASTAFNISLTSTGDFSGVLVDGKPIHSANISSFTLDIPPFAPWLHYDDQHRVLGGTPPTDVTVNTVVPVILKTTFNQTIMTNISVAIVPSFFSQDTLPPIRLGADRKVQFDLSKFFHSQAARDDDVNITASFEPENAFEFLRFDDKGGGLTGQFPKDQTTVTVTFTAYSLVTHSTSHTKLTITAPSGLVPGSLKFNARRSLYLGLAIGLGIFALVIILGGTMAIVRRYTRVKDTALQGEEGMSAWNAQERKWYGLDDGSPPPETDSGKAETPGQPTPSTQSESIYGSIGRGLRRMAGFSPGTSFTSTGSPGVMKKGEFIGRIRQTIRRVSDKVARPIGGRPSPKPLQRPQIGKPILLNSNAHIEGLPYSPDHLGNPFEPSYAPSSFTGVTDSPTNSTGGRSVPKRRPDFQIPKASVHFEDTRHSRHGSGGSVGSDGSAVEAVVMTATRTPSIRSARSLSALSHGEFMVKTHGPSTLSDRPRLVPANDPRVPVPSLAVTEPMTGGRVVSVVSQTAEVFRNSSTSDNISASGSADDLSIGVHYVNSLGADGARTRPAPNHSTLTVSTHGRSSFSSLSRGSVGSADQALMSSPPMILGAGQRFKFKLPLSVQGDDEIEVRLTTGQPLPSFLYADLRAGMRKGYVEFSGAPTSKDFGEICVGVYTTAGICVGQQKVMVSKTR